VTSRKSAGIPFLALGVTFLAVGATGRQAFLAIGLTFLVLGVVLLLRRTRT
jgi:hypothetical protein